MKRSEHDRVSYRRPGRRGSTAVVAVLAAVGILFIAGVIFLFVIADKNAKVAYEDMMIESQSEEGSLESLLEEREKAAGRTPKQTLYVYPVRDEGEE